MTKSTNHPVNGPVSVDRLHQIREHLQHDTQYSNGGNRAYILGDMLNVIDEVLASRNAEPNFDVNGNSPGTPDSWISCSDRMPEKGQNVLISVNFDSSLVEPLICSARYTGSTFRRGDATIKPGNGIEQATHWMPLPEPPQEVK